MERTKLEINEATKMLPDGDTVHTFRNSAGMLIGADWDRADVLDAIKKHGVELSGSQATAMGHGLVLEDATGFLFVETKKQ
jgi:hypothetical protein